MTSSDNGWALQEELLRTIAQVYAWPALPARKKPRSLPVENTSVNIHVMENTQNISEQQGKSGFTNVDKAAVPEEYIQLLDAQQRMAFVQLYKQRARILLDLQPGQQVLDAGAGTGEDAQVMAALIGPTGQVVALAFSQAMVEIAQQRSQGKKLPLRFVQGDIHQLPFVDNTFDRCYADKTFEHLPDPKRALSELIRVTKPGGIVVTVDPDHETQVLDSPYPNVTQRFFRFRSDGLRQPGIAHRMYALFKANGLSDVQVEPLTRVTTDYETLRPVAHFIEGMRSAQQQGVVTEEEAELWIAALEEAIQTGRFFHAMTSFITSGRKHL
jgi:ubiquinone/menaquinone biosynthesis C-methylase UbiE